jgi:hypothetical protein
MPVRRERFEEKPGNLYRLGRHMELDSESLPFAVQATRQPIKPVDWPAPLPILNQGQTGSCTGNAGTRHLAALYGAADLGKISLDGRALNGTDAGTDEQFALALYHEATVKDGFPGIYPPNDTGSSGLAVCKALKAAKQITAYHWATSLRAWATLMQTSGTIIGMPWYESFFSPDAQGFIDSGNWEASGVAGGHEIYVVAIEAWDDNDPSKVVFRLDNSWNTSWGDHGSFRMRGSTYVRLKGQIDIKQFRRE